MIFFLLFTICLLLTIFTSCDGAASSSPKICIVKDKAPHATLQPMQAKFTNVAQQAGLVDRQCFIRTTPNCLFKQYDPKLDRWDKGGFCLEETMTGGACIGDADNDGIDDIFFPRLDGHDILYRNRGDGTFADFSKQANLDQYPDTHSNGCHFIDIDNDGDNDVYVSTVGDTRFYLYVNDGTGKFTEEAIERGLGNAKYDGRLTGGFTIGISDVDLDGDLDIVTTEWLPWLEHSEADHGHHKDKVSMEGIMNKKKLIGENATNSRLYINQGPGKNIGHFVDFSKQANVEVNVEVNADVTSHLKSVCQLLTAKEANATLQLLGEPVVPSADPIEAEENVHRAYHRLVQMWVEGKTVRGKMAYTARKGDAKHYKHLRIGPNLLPQGASTLTLSISASKEKGPVQLYVGDDKIERPVAARHAYTFKTKPTTNGTPRHMSLALQGAWGSRVHYIGVRENV